MSNINTKVITGLVRFSYANVWEPKAFNGDKPKYSISLIIPKEDKKTLKEIQEAIEGAKDMGLGKFGGKLPAKLKLPLHDGDIDRPEDEAYRNSFYLTATSFDAPRIVNKYVKAIVDKNEFYSGCYGKASINFYAYNFNGNKGIAAGLGNLQKIRDGEAFSGRTMPEEEFFNEEEEELLS